MRSPSDRTCVNNAPTVGPSVVPARWEWTSFDLARSQRYTGVVKELTWEIDKLALAKIDVTISWEPEGMTEALGAKIGADTMGVKRDLENFKELIEGRGVETGAWRGEVIGGERVNS